MTLLYFQLLITLDDRPISVFTFLSNFEGFKSFFLITISSHIIFTELEVNIIRTPLQFLGFFQLPPYLSHLSIIYLPFMSIILKHLFYP